MAFPVPALESLDWAEKVTMAPGICLEARCHCPPLLAEAGSHPGSLSQSPKTPTAPHFPTSSHTPSRLDLCQVPCLKWYLLTSKPHPIHSWATPLPQRGPWVQTPGTFGWVRCLPQCECPPKQMLDKDLGARCLFGRWFPEAWKSPSRKGLGREESAQGYVTELWAWSSGNWGAVLPKTHQRSMYNTPQSEPAGVARRLRYLHPLWYFVLSGVPLKGINSLKLIVWLAHGQSVLWEPDRTCRQTQVLEAGSPLDRLSSGPTDDVPVGQGNVRWTRAVPQWPRPPGGLSYVLTSSLVTWKLALPPEPTLNCYPLPLPLSLAFLFSWSGGTCTSPSRMLWVPKEELDGNTGEGSRKINDCGG